MGKSCLVTISTVRLQVGQLEKVRAELAAESTQLGSRLEQLHTVLQIAGNRGRHGDTA